MTVKTALKVFNALEEERITELAGDPPTYDVRVDAGTDREDGTRTARVRVTAGRESGGLTADNWRYVLDVVDEYEIPNVVIANDGIELS